MMLRCEKFNMGLFFFLSSFSIWDSSGSHCSSAAGEPSCFSFLGMIYVPAVHGAHILCVI